MKAIAILLALGAFAVVAAWLFGRDSTPYDDLLTPDRAYWPRWRRLVQRPT